jgi:hypothetical protein
LWKHSGSAASEGALVDADLDPDADPFKPPPGSILVHCIHCGEEYESYRIEWRVFDRPDGRHGLCCCPIEGCDGAGFGFDIFPVDEEQAAELGIMMFSDDDDDEDFDSDDDDFGPDDPGPAAQPNSSDNPPSMDDDIPF